MAHFPPAHRCGGAQLPSTDERRALLPLGAERGKEDADPRSQGAARGGDEVGLTFGWSVGSRCPRTGSGGAETASAARSSSEFSEGDQRASCLPGAPRAPALRPVSRSKRAREVGSAAGPLRLRGRAGRRRCLLPHGRDEGRERAASAPCGPRSWVQLSTAQARTDVLGHQRSPESGAASRREGVPGIVSHLFPARNTGEHTHMRHARLHTTRVHAAHTNTHMHMQHARLHTTHVHVAHTNTYMHMQHTRLHVVTHSYM